ncbi:capsular polysaccharide biosynthesis protein [uncultured Azohydromonas sp.]|uniref:capsular polysaccharide biosynthesis protein n=1 Tax=uncultured Azohydromonas sp. TaxID=487342 RepID=UPI00261428C8|nr:capsular polysaccharide biosynthesis protein [uncultured Azohydromonas sp.]
MSSGPSGAQPLRCAVLSLGMRRLRTLALLLDDAEVVPLWRSHDVDAVLAWGHKRAAARAEAWAAWHKRPLLRVEDGFLRSLGLGADEPPLSVVVDDLGIYYDAARPSRLEQLAQRVHSAAELERAAALARQWRQARVSKYNHARESAPPVDGPFVLVVDQTAGDASIRHGQADAGSFARMLEAALREHPQRPVLLKVHPDVAAGRKQGHFPSLTPAQAARVTVLADAAHPCALLEACAAVYTVTSQLGFEALLWGKPVRCFGMPFYAGWGLTRDELPAPARRAAAPPRTLEDLVHAALIEYPRYIDPDTGRRCEVERLLEWMALQRRMRSRFAPEIHALGFSRWKRPIVEAFLAGSRVRFVKELSQVPAGATLAVWGRRAVPSADQPHAPAQVLRLEDGFLRSVGLGADLVWPLSWVVDAQGLYYDASAPSGLERLLATTEFTPALLARAAALRERVLALGLTKYNVGTGQWRRPAGQARVILVPGQVESDASITYGAPMLRTNMALLQAVRRSAPDAWVVYKPHPDVLAQLRRAGVDEHEARQHCNEVVTDVPMQSLLEAVDEVHVMTSLTGFEALLRGRHVRTYGCPFYAGWGLTEDMAPVARRTRRLTLDALVAGALILYPSYIDRQTRHFVTPEQALDALARWRVQDTGTRRRTHWALRPLLQIASLIKKK